MKALLEDNLLYFFKQDFVRSTVDLLGRKIKTGYSQSSGYVRRRPRLLGIVTPHKNGYSHHDESININNIFPYWVFIDVRYFVRFHLLRVLGATCPPTQTAKQVTDTRFFIHLCFWKGLRVSTLCVCTICECFTDTCIIILLPPFLSLSLGRSSFLLLLPVQIFPLLFRMT